MTRSLSTRPRRTPRLSLRPFHRRDTDAVLEAALSSLSELRLWLPWAHAGYSRRDAAAFIRESISAWHEGRAFDFTIRRAGEPDRHLGNVSVWFTSRNALIGEVGYWVRNDESSKGICTEATATILDTAFNELSMHRVVLRIAVGNVASERVAEKLGFAKEGLLREEVRVNAKWLDHTLWGLLDHEHERLQTEYLAAGWV